MKYIFEEKINNLLLEAKNTDRHKLDVILEKSRQLKRLSLLESAALLCVDDPEYIKKIFSAANFVKNKIYGRRIVLFAPLYISNFCVNSCLYCAFKSDNPLIKRKSLTVTEIKTQTEWLLARGHKRILMVCGEEAPAGQSNIDYYVQAVGAIYDAEVGKNKIRRVNVNCAPLTVDEFKLLKKSGIGTYQIFQETYHQQTYQQMHPKGPKSDPDNRIDAVDRAFSAGIDDIGIGALFGLYDYKFETLGLLSHVEHMEEKFKVGPHTISVPRIEPAVGSALSLNPPYKISDEDFKKVVAILRLSVPYTGIIMSTRESVQMRDKLLTLGVSQISAESNTSPGGYSVDDQEQAGGQFSVGDHRSLDQIVETLINHDYIPSFCAACYRKERTGEAFMQLAKPGQIKDKCNINALVTLKEYLDDFASEDVKTIGVELIKGFSEKLNISDEKLLQEILKHVDNGVRDEFV